MDKSKRKPQFQIRKVPFRRNPPEKTPVLNALDVHSICLPNRSRKGVNWGTLSENNYQQQINPEVIYSQAYQQLYKHYTALRQHHSQQRSSIQKQIDQIQQKIGEDEQKKRRLHGMRDGLSVEVQHLREGLNEVRDKNYNLRWEIYHQRGAHYMNVNGFSLFQGGEMSYEELLQMEEQMGSVPKGLTQEEISMIPFAVYSELKPYLPYRDHKNKDKKLLNQKEKTITELSNQQICCICFDSLEQTDQILRIPCQHTHHRECLRDWLLKQRVCPICKQQILAPPQQL